MDAPIFCFPFSISTLVYVVSLLESSSMRQLEYPDPNLLKNALAFICYRADCHTFYGHYLPFSPSDQTQQPSMVGSVLPMKLLVLSLTSFLTWSSIDIMQLQHQKCVFKVNSLSDSTILNLTFQPHRWWHVIEILYSVHCVVTSGKNLKCFKYSYIQFCVLCYIAQH